MVATFRSASVKGATLGADVTIAKPAGAVEGDVIFAIGRCTGGLTKPSAEWFIHPNSFSSAGPLFWLPCGASEPADYTFVTGGSGSAVVLLVCYSGVDNTSPTDDADVFVGTGNLTLPSVDSLGGTLAQLCCKLNAVTWTPPGTAAEHFDALDTGFSGAAGDETVSSGATGSRLWTPSLITGNGIGYILALNDSSVDASVVIPSAASATAQGEVPTVTGGASVEIPSSASANAQGIVPDVSVGGAVSFSVPEAALATAQGQVPTVTTEVLQTSITNIARLRAAAALSIIEPELSTIDTGWLLREYWGRRAGIVGDLSEYSVNDIISVNFPGSHFIRDVV